MSGPPLTVLTAVAAPLLRDNINTDVIIPSREMKTVSRRGLADGLFADWRYTAPGGREPRTGFVLNDPRYAHAQILLSGANFGCGSSREHAAWALAEYGFRAVIASSFNPIFRNNAAVNGIAAVGLPMPQIERLAELVEKGPETNRLTIDLERLGVTSAAGEVLPFAMDQETREMLMEGLDGIDLTMKCWSEIAAFRDADRRRRPWAYPSTEVGERDRID